MPVVKKSYRYNTGGRTVFSVSPEDEVLNRRLKEELKIASISDELLAKLDALPKSRAGDLMFCPAAARLKEGNILRAVYFMDVDNYLDHFGYDRSRRYVRIQSVADILPSRYRLKPEFADRIYAYGEAKRGGYVFSLRMKDQREYVYVTGTVVDFPVMPEGYTVEDVVDVLPGEGLEHVNRGGEYFGTHDAYWCLFS